jgi:hypothetical protein
MKAAFAKVDITPPVGVKKTGWMMDLTGEVILDPLHARIAIVEADEQCVALISLDVLSVLLDGHP